MNFVKYWQISIQFLKASLHVKNTRIILSGVVFDCTMMFIWVSSLEYSLVLKSLLEVSGNFIEGLIFLIWVDLKYTFLYPFSTIIDLLTFLKDYVLTLRFLSFRICQLHRIFNGFFHRRFWSLMLFSFSILVQNTCKAVYLFFLILDY